MRKTKEEKLREKTLEQRIRRERQYKALAYLKHVRGLASRVKSLQGEIDHVRETLDGVKSANAGERIRFGSVYADSIPDATVRLEEMICEYCKELVVYIDAQKQAHDLVKRLPDKDQASVLVTRYLIGASLESTSYDLGFSLEDTVVLENAGLEALFDHMPQYWRDKAIPDCPDFEAVRRRFRQNALTIG